MNRTKLAALHAPDPLQHHGYCGTVLRVGGPALLDEGLVGGRECWVEWWDAGL